VNRRGLGSALRRRVDRDPLLRELRSAAAEQGVSCWLLGGYVRDVALGRTPADVDLVSGKGTLRLVRRLEPLWETRGFRFRKRGVTTWRFNVRGRSVDLVDAGHRGLEADLARRELTINAVAFDLAEHAVVDPTQGLRDIRSGRLRLPRPGVMLEDPVRPLRAARFLAQLDGFTLDREAQAEAQSAARKLGRASVERIRDELDKLLLAPNARRGLDAMFDLELVEGSLPELLPLASCVAGADRPDVWHHTLDTIEISQNAGRRRLPAAGVVREPDARRVLRWSLLLHDISKPETLALAEDGRPTFHGHETLGEQRCAALLQRLRMPRAESRRIGRIIRNHLRPSLLAESGSPPRGMRRLVRQAGADLPLLVLHSACDALGSGGPRPVVRWRKLRRTLLDLLELHAELGTGPLPRLVSGDDVMRILDLTAGPGVGRALRRLEEQQQEGSITSRREALRFLRRLAEGDS